MYFDSAMRQKIKETIRNMWHRLTDEEIDSLEEYRDLFFLAVSRKHGVVRSQAQLLLNEIERQLYQSAKTVSLQNAPALSTAGGN